MSHLFYSNEKGLPRKAHLHIEEDGHATLTVQHLLYAGNATMCEGGILSVYFTHCNGIPHCGQIIAKVGKKSRNEMDNIEAKWLLLNEHFEPNTLQVVLCAEEFCA